MLCPSCNHDNRADRRFCTECGAVLSAACPSCGAPIQAGEKFCYAWFTEGSDTQDLIDAKALLDEL